MLSLQSTVCAAAAPCVFSGSLNPTMSLSLIKTSTANPAPLGVPVEAEAAEMRAGRECAAEAVTEEEARRDGV